MERSAAADRLKGAIGRNAKRPNISTIVCIDE